MPEPEPSAAPAVAQDIPAQILLRALQGVEGLEAQLQDLTMRYAERDDLPGVGLLLRACAMLTNGIKRQLIDNSRAVGEAAYAGPDNGRQRARAEQHQRHIPLDARLEPSVRILRRFEALLRVRLELVSETHGATFDALSGPFTRLAKALPGDRDIELIFRPSPGTLYEIWFQVLEELQELGARRFGPEMAAVFDRMPRLMAIEYPWHYERDTFMHAVIAHEIGHIAFVNGRTGNQVWLDAARDHGMDADRAAAYRRWFIEFACDALAVRMIGPAYPLALVEHTLGQNWWFAPQATYGETTHPPVPTRIRLLESEVARFFNGATPNSLSHRSTLVAAEATTDSWMHKLPADDGIPDDVEPVINAALSALNGHNVLGEAEYRVETFREQLGPVWDALSAGVAPAEIVYVRDRGLRKPEEGTLRSAWSEPTDWRTILNGGYLRWLHEARGDKLPDLLRRGAAITNDRLERCAHIQGAIELSELHRAMLTQRNELSALDMQMEP
jgi:hypothetical protein